MSWLQLKVQSSQQQAELVSDLLEDLGAVSVTFMDSEDSPIFEPQPGETRLWGNTDVIALFEADKDINNILEVLSAGDYLAEDFYYEIQEIADQAWERTWMDDFEPMRFGKRLWICPSWSQPTQDDNAVTILLDPGLAFGTGTHPTTALCLEWLDGQDLSGKTVIDYGCGSGVLAVAALKLGAEKVIGIDIDPQAIEASRDNARKNFVDDKLFLFLADEFNANFQGDILIANILASPLIELAPTITKLVKPEGNLTLSGILNNQAEEVIEAYKQNFTIKPVVEREEWCRISGVKK